MRRKVRSRRDPWADTPVGELSEPLLPRWFVLLAVALVPVALVVAGLALFGFGPRELAVAERRPPPAGGYTHDVGAALVGDSPAIAYAGACPEVAGLHLAGTETDRALLRRSLAALCNVPLERDLAAALRDLAGAGAHVRFAAFEATGVDSAAEPGHQPPRLLVNARFARAGRPGWIAPLVAHDAVTLAGDPASAETALAARRAEAAVCDALVGTAERSRGCDDAAELLAGDDPLAALRDAGYR